MPRITCDLYVNQRTLVSALESTINMLKEVELHEERAEQAKKEASVAGEDIFQEAEDLRQKINHAKITNEKVVFHASLALFQLYGK